MLMRGRPSAQPNAHYWALWLINKNFGPGDKLIATTSTDSDLAAQASITPSGRKILLVNTTDHSIDVDLAGVYRGEGLTLEVVDQNSGAQQPQVQPVTGAHISLAPFAVAVVSQHAR